MQTRIQLTLALCALAVVVVAGLAALAYLKFESLLSESVSERIEILATTLARDFGSTVNLGLSLSEVANGEEILQRSARADPDISTLAVFALSGEVIYGVGEPPASVGSAALDHLDEESGWHAETPDHLAAVRPILGSFGSPVGGVLVEYPTGLLRTQEAGMRRRLLTGGSWIAVLMCALTVGLVGIATRERTTQ